MSTFKILVMVIVPAASLMADAPELRAETMAEVSVCRYDKMVLCSAFAASASDPCDKDKTLFTVTNVAIGAGGMAFQIDLDGGGTVFARGRNDMMGYGVQFEHAQTAYALTSDGDNSIALVVRSSGAETWTGSCMVKSADIDRIEAGAANAR